MVYLSPYGTAIEENILTLKNYTLPLIIYTNTLGLIHETLLTIFGVANLCVKWNGTFQKLSSGFKKAIVSSRVPFMFNCRIENYIENRLLK